MALSTRHQRANDLVDMKDGWISRDIFVDPDLYEPEKERVFARAWLFVGFEDQVKKPGDYFVSRMGEESVILSRDRDNTVHVFLNSCRHRGMKVCRYDEGNTPVFTCPYHGWSYAGDGSLVGVPRYKDAYREELDKSQWGLVEVAQMENYKGMVWATWDPEAPAFFEYIGDMRPHLDTFLDKPDGSEADLEVVGGVYKWTLPCNWKFGAENFIGDVYHTTTTHRSADLLRSNPSGIQGRQLASGVLTPAISMNASHHGSGWRAGIYPPNVGYVPSYPTAPTVDTYFQVAHEKRQQSLGERARLRGDAPRGGNVFPNTTCGTGQTVGVWHPNGPDSTEVWRWYFMQKDAPQEAKDLLRHFYMRYGGPAGLTEKDDMENWNYAHRASKGTMARRYPYAYAMGLGYEQRHSSLTWLRRDGLVTEKVMTEQNQRGMYKMWADYMDAERWEDVKTMSGW